MLKEFQNDTIIVHVSEPYDIYIGRGMNSEWGNPYTHIKTKQTKAQFITRTREEAISKYREWIISQPQLIDKLLSLKGKRLACWCKKPGNMKSCHGDVLLELIREYDI